MPALVCPPSSAPAGAPHRRRTRRPARVRRARVVLHRRPHCVRPADGRGAAVGRRVPRRPLAARARPPRLCRRLRRAAPHRPPAASRRRARRRAPPPAPARRPRPRVAGADIRADRLARRHAPRAPRGLAAAVADARALAVCGPPRLLPRLALPPRSLDGGARSHRPVAVHARRIRGVSPHTRSRVSRAVGEEARRDTSTTPPPFSAVRVTPSESTTPSPIPVHAHVRLPTWSFH
mmetsp:Transcript_12091/g.38817  ORF Transcript_12091/g.38817 Transcript_12091/m.38817 type:complete len:235 (+) Transcript_12091:87-791(+)